MSSAPHPLQVVIGYDALSHFVGEEVYVVQGECSWLNFVHGTIQSRNGVYFVKYQKAEGTAKYPIKRQSDCDQCPWLGDGVWFKGIFLGQVI